jgi:hypothetical protein
MKKIPLLVCVFLLVLLVPEGLAVADTPAPHITSISPSTAPVGSTITLVISGSDFVQGSRAMIYPCFEAPQSYSVSYDGPSQLTVHFTFYKTGNWHIKVQNPDSDITEVIPFSVYDSSGTTPTTTTTTTTETTIATATTTPSQGKNSIFFETNPTGATIYVDGTEAGSSAFKYYTDKDGTFNVVAKKLGYEDYEGKVTVVDGGPTARFYGLLTPLASTGSTTTTAVTSPGATVKTTTTITNATTTYRKSTLKIPTPLGTDPPLTAEESPVNPAIALWAVGIALLLLVIRRR